MCLSNNDLHAQDRRLWHGTHTALSTASSKKEYAMNTTLTRSALGLVMLAAPLAAQVRGRHDHAQQSTAVNTSGTIGSVLGSADSRTSTSAHIPPGQLPPRGMCRVWIDGVPPGRQPAVTDCATAERMRLQYPNSRVIYGDQAAFPGNGKGKAKNRRSSSTSASSRGCLVWDTVDVLGQPVPVCRRRSTDATGSVRTRSEREGDDEVDDRNERDDDDQGEDGGRRARGIDISSAAHAKVKHGKHGKGHDD